MEMWRLLNLSKAVGLTKRDRDMIKAGTLSLFSVSFKRRKLTVSLHFDAFSSDEKSKWLK